MHLKRIIFLCAGLLSAPLFCSVGGIRGGAEFDRKAKAALLPALKTVDDLPALCLQVVKLVAEQPAVDGVKAVPVASWRVGRIVEIIGDNSSTTWPIRVMSDFYKGNRRLAAYHALVMKADVVLPSVDDLKAAFEGVVNKLSEGWTRVDVRRMRSSGLYDQVFEVYPQRNWENWVLLTKEPKLTEELNLLTLLAPYLNLLGSYECYSISGSLYLMIPAKALKSVVKALRLPQQVLFCM